MPNNEEDKQRAKDQAGAQLESIKEMVQALQCDYESIDQLGEELEGLTSLEDAKTANLQASWEELQKYLSEAGECESEEDAQQRIQEDPLSLEVRSGWCSPGTEEAGKPEEFKILLCTGGPAVQIIGELDEYGQPESAKIQYQDWFIPWMDYALDSEDESAVLEYCSQFYFGD